jgi:hypothetical protein
MRLAKFKLVEGPPGSKIQVDLEYSTPASRQVNNLDGKFPELAEKKLALLRKEV